MRITVAVWLLFAGLLEGCTTQTRVGNFVENAVVANEKKMAADSVKKLVELYPPARTMFFLKQPTPDAFGTSLVRSIREKGYALMEFKAGGRADSDAVSLPYAGNALPLTYTVAEAQGLNIYLVSLGVGTQSLARAYQMHLTTKTIYTAGSWVHKE